MPSGVHRAQYFYERKYPGIRKVRKGNRVYYRITLVSGRKVLVTPNQLIWHRGNGKYSIYTGEHDRLVKAKTRISRKAWRVHRHEGDKRFSLSKL